MLDDNNSSMKITPKEKNHTHVANAEDTKKIEFQRKGRNKDIRSLLMFNVYFLIVFNFVLFSILGTDEVFVGQRYADAVYRRPKVNDDGPSCHRGEGKSIINDCTDGSSELPLR